MLLRALLYPRVVVEEWWHGCWPGSPGLHMHSHKTSNSIAFGKSTSQRFYPKPHTP